jgi:hypothetical protein
MLKIKKLEAHFYTFLFSAIMGMFCLFVYNFAQYIFLGGY